MEASALSLSSSLQSRSVSFASNSSLSSARPAPSAALALSSAPIPGLSVFCSDWHVTARAACFSSRKTSCWEWSGARSVAMQATVGTGDVDSAVTLATNPGGNAAAAAATQNADSSVDVRVDAAAASNSNAVGSGKKSKGDLSPGKMARRAADWRRAEKCKEDGEVVLGQVEACTRNGLVVRFYSLLGFMPYSQTSVVKDETKTVADIGKELIGTMISVKLLEASEEQKKLIFSEREAVRIQTLKLLQKGDVYEGRVNGITDYGAFVDLRFPDGSYPLTGLVHVSELSWDPVSTPQDVLQVGQEVRVQIANVDLENARVSLSIKQLQADPLLETLDTLMPVDSQEASFETNQSDLDGELIGTYLPGIELICDELLKEEGITGATLGRQALEKRVVSQDLELWLSNAVGENGKFTILARAGRQVQEIYVNSALDREGMKTAVQQVTSRLP
ncbi:hypothetical protein O6H91_03G089000 [Diphasiastrum complanatum]|uniref:Uncharacterized protein n=1 Tax=Diphasiastrum complanatum TaxID=34168 RepID=A0ACC2E8X1_DIPCM|nr:hypothetical protein O6H91_03G089000 [Diphasiastrum complanatum]